MIYHDTKNNMADMGSNTKRDRRNQREQPKREKVAHMYTCIHTCMRAHIPWSGWFVWDPFFGFVSFLGCAVLC